MIYLDYNATTPIDPTVADAMMPFITENYGNPSSSHAMGQTAKAAVGKARTQVANLLGAKPSEIIFTSGGSESNNTVIKGVAYTYREKGNHIITSQIEHPAVTNPCSFLEQNGYEITRVPVNDFGEVNPKDIEEAFTDKTILVTIMHANNETGTIQPISEISKICKEAGVLFHTDAAQSIGKVPTKVDELGVDFLSVAGHKLYAPKGIGALYIREGVSIEPFVHGAGHENGRRAGTENVIFDVAIGTACELVSDFSSINQTKELTNYFYKELKKLFGEKLRLNGHPENRLPNTLYLSFTGYSLTQLQEALEGVAVSTGSACHSDKTSLSPVLKAMGVQDEGPSATIRFSLGRYTTVEEIQTVIDQLRTISSGK